jgi:hypothetical protein
LNEEQYRLLCEACDRVLLATDSTLERVAIPWLHVIREHPVFLANYVDLFASTKGGRAIVRKLWRFFRSRAGWYRQIGRSLRSDGQPWFGPEELPSGIDVLFVSHLLNPSHAGQADDFYFGGLPNEMVASGQSAVIALINQSGQAAPYLVDKWKGSSVLRVILSSSIRFLEEVVHRRRLKMESLRLRKLANKEAPGLARRVLARASEEALSGGSLTTLRIASQIGALVARLRPKAIVVTHEGHAWERVAFASARRAFPGVRCIGYQHAALFRLQHAIRRNIAPEYNPDHILTAGTVSKAQLEHSPGLNGIPISVLGSNRTFRGATINGERPLHPGLAEHSGNSTCLVLPEGIASECYLLFEFSLDCAQASPEIQFIWRLHPLITHKSLAAQNPRLRNLPRNIVLSQATLEEDIARCRWALYRGTTAIIPAVVAGLRPLYLQFSDEMTIDPLYELKGWRTSVKTIAEFHRVIKYDQDRMLRDSESEIMFAEGYCRAFFIPLNPNVLEAAIISKGKA